MKRRNIVLALLAAASAHAHAETAVTVYSSARPGTLDPRVFRTGGEGMAIPGYALVREQRSFALKPGRNLLRAWPRAAWLNPVPEDHWRWTTSILNVQSILEGRMYPVTISGLEKAMKSLA